MMAYFEVNKHPAPFNGLDYCFNIPTFGGFKGQVLSYRLKKDAVRLAVLWQNAYDTWEKAEYIKKLSEPRPCTFEDIGDEPPVDYGDSI